MRVLATFYTLRECEVYIIRRSLKNVIIDHCIFSGKYSILETA
jgi:hypothetical protein